MNYYRIKSLFEQQVICTLSLSMFFILNDMLNVFGIIVSLLFYSIIHYIFYIKVVNIYFSNKNILKYIMFILGILFCAITSPFVILLLPIETIYLLNKKINRKVFIEDEKIKELDKKFIKEMFFVSLVKYLFILCVVVIGIISVSIFKSSIIGLAIIMISSMMLILLYFKVSLNMYNRAISIFDDIIYKECNPQIVLPLFKDYVERYHNFYLCQIYVNLLIYHGDLELAKIVLESYDFIKQTLMYKQTMLMLDYNDQDYEELRQIYGQQKDKEFMLDGLNKLNIVHNLYYKNYMECLRLYDNYLILNELDEVIIASKKAICLMHLNRIEEAKPLIDIVIKKGNTTGYVKDIKNYIEEYALG